MDTRVIKLGIFTIILCQGCRTALPKENTFPTTTIMDASLQTEATQCKNHMNELIADAKSSGNFSDAMTIIGGVVGTAGSISAATFQAVNPDSQAQTIISASVAGAGSLVAIISKIVDSPTTSLNRYSKAHARWHAARSKLDPSMTPNNENYAQVRQSFIDCQNDTE